MLKHLLTIAPALRVADPNQEFELCIDACKEGVGAILSQEGRVIAYESKKLKDHEKHYSIYDLELTGVVHTLKVWRHYLLGKRFMLKTDQSSLTNYFKKSHLNARHIRWNAFLSDFYFEIQHVKGKENRVADALSRKLHCMYELYFNQLELKFQDQIKEES